MRLSQWCRLRQSFISLTDCGLAHFSSSTNQTSHLHVSVEFLLLLSEPLYWIIFDMQIYLHIWYRNITFKWSKLCWKAFCHLNIHYVIIFIVYMFYILYCKMSIFKLCLFAVKSLIISINTKITFIFLVAFHNEHFLDWSILIIHHLPFIINYDPSGFWVTFTCSSFNHHFIAIT